VELPDRVEFQMDGSFGEIILSNMDLTKVKGRILLKDRILTLSNLTANFLDGTIVSDGSYRYVKPDMPHINLDLKLSQMNIPAMFKTFNTVQRFAPMAGYMQGKVSGDLNLNSQLGDSLMPLWQTVLSKGTLQIADAKFEGFKPLNAVADAIKLDQLRDPALRDLSPSYEIKDGFFHLKPVTFKIGGYQVVATGANGLDKSLDYSLNLQIPAEQLKTSANATIAGLVGKDLNLLTDETISLNTRIGGTVDNPKVETSPGQIVKGATKQLQEEAMKQAEQKKQELENQAKDEIAQRKAAVEDSIKRAAEAQKEQQGQKLKDKLKGLLGK